MEKSIHKQAYEIKALIEENHISITPALSDFAENFAFSHLLKEKALSLELSYSLAQNDSERNDFKPEMRDLIDEIVSDYLEGIELLLMETFGNESQKKQLQANILSKETSAVVFESKNLGKRFKKNGFHLQNLDMELRIGEITGVVGENGNGKTTFFRICVGELGHSEGQIRYPDLHQNHWNKIDWYAVKQSIAFIPQELAIWHGSLRNNLSLEAALHGFKGKKNEEAVRFILQRMELEAYLDKSWSELSGGYKLRFALAKALVWKPRLLVLDEPLANLDINAQHIILNDLKDLVESRIFPISVMISSQHLHEIEKVSDKLLYLKAGKEIYYGKTSDFGKERLENVFELDCGLTLQIFEAYMKDFEYLKLTNNGLSIVIHTPLHITEKNLLAHLLAKDIKINYFRNISQSIKKFFV